VDKLTRRLRMIHLR